MLLGVDAPIGLPQAYAVRHVALPTFRDFIAALRPDDPFFSVCDRIEQVSGARPFFPRSPAFAPRRHAHATRLGVGHHDELLRDCDRRTADRPRAACLFWTLGPNQVGKAALSLWRELLLPAADRPALWPFEGSVQTLLRTRRTIVAEAYPAEALAGLAPRWGGSKRRQTDRARLAPVLAARMTRLGVEPDAELADALGDGFGPRPEAEDRFDSLLGLLGMLAVLGEPGMPDAPDTDKVRRWEGWILGQRA